jgi:hypothetical protein
MFFFEKKNQKTFASLVPRTALTIASGCWSAGAKVFSLLFFQKKKTFLT